MKTTDTLKTAALDYLRAAKAPAVSAAAPRPAAAVAQKLGVTVQKAVAVLRQLVAAGDVSVFDEGFGGRYYAVRSIPSRSVDPRGGDSGRRRRARLAGVAYSHLAYSRRTSVPGGIVSTIGVEDLGGKRYETAFVPDDEGDELGIRDDRRGDLAEMAAYHDELVALLRDPDSPPALAAACRDEIQEAEARSDELVRRFPSWARVTGHPDARFVPVALAVLLAWTAFAAGQQAARAHVQTDDAARKARQATHVLLKSVDDEDLSDGFQGRVSAPAGTPQAARPFREVA